MHIETSADARQSRRHAAGGGLAGPAADDRGYLAAAASRFSSWWHGDRRPPALTADTASGAGLQGGNAWAVHKGGGGSSPRARPGGQRREGIFGGRLPNDIRWLYRHRRPTAVPPRRRSRAIHPQLHLIFRHATSSYGSLPLL